MNRLDDLSALAFTWLCQAIVAVDAKIRPRAYKTTHERRRQAEETQRRREAGER